MPRLVSEADGGAADTQVTIGTAALQLIPSLVFGRTLEQLARERGLVRTLRDIANLMDGGLVKLDPQPPVAQTTVIDAPVLEQPLVERPTVVERPIPIRPSTARPIAPRTSAAIPPGVAARLGAARTFAIEPLSPASLVFPQKFPGWRKAVISFFLTDEERSA